jgi:hypothetical protein
VNHALSGEIDGMGHVPNQPTTLDDATNDPLEEGIDARPHQESDRRLAQKPSRLGSKIQLLDIAEVHK